MSKLRHYPEFVVARVHDLNRSDRRSWPRYPSMGVGCWMGWWQDGKPRIVMARIRDVGQAGAAVDSRICPTKDRLVWIHPLGDSSIGWIEGTVVRVTSPGWIGSICGRTRDVGIRFHQICAWEALRDTLFGGRESSAPELAPPTLPGPGSMGP